MTPTTTAHPRAHERRQCGSNTSHDPDDEYVFAVVTDDHDGDGPVSYSVRLNPTEAHQTVMKRRVTQRDRACAETTAHRSSSPGSTVTRRNSLREDALDSLVEAWYHHDYPSADPNPEESPTENVSDDASERDQLFEAGSG